jgi:hypothetical protein
MMTKVKKILVSWKIKNRDNYKDNQGDSIS